MVMECGADLHIGRDHGGFVTSPTPMDGYLNIALRFSGNKELATEPGDSDAARITSATNAARLYSAVRVTDDLVIVFTTATPGDATWYDKRQPVRSPRMADLVDCVMRSRGRTRDANGPWGHVARN